ncbi:MAG: 4Fe-4S dicluster domain-containing protein [Methanobacteriota archaeon]
MKCSGGVRCKGRFDYSGVPSCAQASLLGGGQKACAWGCLGFGDCVKTCPKKLFELTPKSNRFHVLCKSKDNGAFVRSVCEVGCIGCGLCVRNCSNEACMMEENLSRIEYAKCTNAGKCAEVCPTKAIKRF